MLFFFQAEDGIRDRNVTGVQTCALPILFSALPTVSKRSSWDSRCALRRRPKIGRASCRERAKGSEGAGVMQRILSAKTCGGRHAHERVVQSTCKTLEHSCETDRGARCRM